MHGGRHFPRSAGRRGGGGGGELVFSEKATRQLPRRTALRKFEGQLDPLELKFSKECGKFYKLSIAHAQKRPNSFGDPSARKGEPPRRLLALEAGGLADSSYAPRCLDASGELAMAFIKRIYSPAHRINNRLRSRMKAEKIQRLCSRFLRRAFWPTRCLLR